MPNLEEVDWSYTEILISFDNEKFLIQVNSLILLGRKMSKYLTSIFFLSTEGVQEKKAQR